MAGEIEIRNDQFQAHVADRSLNLTRREFELLQVLAEASGRVIEREDIYQRVWGYAMAHGDRSVDVFIRKLRAKIQSHSPGWEYIHTHFGVGYRFEPQPLAPDADAALHPAPAARGDCDGRGIGRSSSRPRGLARRPAVACGGAFPSRFTPSSQQKPRWPTTLQCRRQPPVGRQAPEGSQSRSEPPSPGTRRRTLKPQSQTNSEGDPSSDL